ncbi:MAG TPA: hypothetical protein VGP68_02720 [Gemmataceae bacterium]|nr:hypothetical protein [Gemmataceae bacterium]
MEIPKASPKLRSDPDPEENHRKDEHHAQAYEPGGMHFSDLIILVTFPFFFVFDLLFAFFFMMLMMLCVLVHIDFSSENLGKNGIGHCPGANPALPGRFIAVMRDHTRPFLRMRLAQRQAMNFG